MGKKPDYIEKYHLQDVLLFKGMTDDEIREAVQFLNAREENYSKNELLLHAGDRVSDLGLILEGTVFIERDGFLGNRTIVTSLDRHQFFGEVFASLPDTPALVNVRAGDRLQDPLSQGTKPHEDRGLRLFGQGEASGKPASDLHEDEPAFDGPFFSYIREDNPAESAFLPEHGFH